MITSQIASVLKQALTTFSTKQDLFYQNLEILKTLLEKTTSEDVNLHQQFMTESLWKGPNKAPVTYIDIYEDPDVTIGIFILKPNMKLPLHNHPDMHGLIKVLAGKLKITSYSLNTDRTREFDNTNQSTTPLTKFLTVERSNEDLVNEHSDCCILTPEFANLHEIQSVDGPAAFIDILAPPYETIAPGGRERKCCYYQILREIGPNVFRLQEVSSPSWYWSDSFPYNGPDLL